MDKEKQMLEDMAQALYQRVVDGHDELRDSCEAAQTVVLLIDRAAIISGGDEDGE